MFLIYISDIGDNFTALKQVYGVDTKQKKSIKSEEDIEVLQDDLEQLHDGAKNTNMAFKIIQF